MFFFKKYKNKISLLTKENDELKKEISHKDEEITFLKSDLKKCESKLISQENSFLKKENEFRNVISMLKVNNLDKNFIDDENF